MAGIGNLDRGAFSGRETKGYYDSVQGSYSDPPTEDPAWVEIKRMRNVQDKDGRSLKDVEMHGSSVNGAIPGYRSRSGTFEYVKKRGTDTVFDYLVTKMRAGDPIYLRLADDDIETSGTKYTDGPVFLGEFDTPKNGNDEVTVTIPYSHADVFDYNGEEVSIVEGTIA